MPTPAGKPYARAFALLLGSFACARLSPAAPAPGEAREEMTNAVLDTAGENSSRTAALYADAVAHAGAGQPDTALDELRQVVALDPLFVDAQVQLGAVLRELKKPDEACTQLKRALAASPGSAALKSALAQAEADRGHGSDAGTLAEQALLKDPTQTSALQILLQRGADRHALETALAQVTDLLVHTDAPVDSYLALVKIYLDLTGRENPQPDGATVQAALLPVYRAAVKKGPPTVDLLFVLADTCHDLDRKTDALQAVQRAQRLDPSNLEAWLRGATLANELGDHALELADYRKAYALNPAQDGLREDLVRALYENRLYDQALRLMQETLTHTPDDAMLQLRIGVTCESLHEGVQAKMWFRKALAAPDCPLDPYLKMAAYYLDLHRPAEAAPVLTEGRRRFPQSAQLAFFQAVQKQDSGDAVSAERCLEEARQLSGGDPSPLGVNFYLVEATVLNATGHRDAIDARLQEGLAKFPDDPNLLNQRAWAWADAGVHLAEALATAQHAATLAPDNGAIQDTLGGIHLKMHQPEKALPYLQQAANLTNNDPSVLQHLGDAYLDRGRRTEALAAWRLGLKKDPANLDLKHRIETNRASPP